MHTSKYKFMLWCYCAHLCNCYYEVRIKHFTEAFHHTFNSLDSLRFCVTFSCCVGGVEFLERPVSQHENKETWIWVGANTHPSGLWERGSDATMTGSTGETDTCVLRTFMIPPGNTEMEEKLGGIQKLNQREESENHSDLPSLWNEGLLGLVTLLKNSSNWKAWGDVSLETQEHTHCNEAVRARSPCFQKTSQVLS